MDDDSGWNAILVEGWGDLVRAAVCDRVEQAFTTARGVLAVAAATPEDAPADAVERVHAAVVVAISTETGANLDQLGSQAAWATYDDVWAELGRRWMDGGPMEPVDPAVEAEVLALLGGLPRSAVEHAGGLLDGTTVRLLHAGGHPLLDAEGLYRWLATDTHADGAVRERARRTVECARRGR